MSKRAAKQAEHDANAAIIAQLTSATEQLVSGIKKPHEIEGTLADARALILEWKIKEASGHRRLLFDDTVPPRTILLAAVVVAQNREIKKLREGHKVLEQLRRHYPGELRTLEQALEGKLAQTAVDEACAVIKTFPLPKRNPKRGYDRKRSSYARPPWGLIEQEFGKLPHPIANFPALSLLLAQPEPRCLDGIFHGERVRMFYLMQLFGLDRHRFPKNLPGAVKRRNSRETEYGYRDVVMIFDALLSEKPRKRRGRKRELWLTDAENPDLRIHVLTAIKERVNSPSVPKSIQSAFVIVINRHLPKSGKK